jgi:hypothetical protein
MQNEVTFIIDTKDGTAKYLLTEAAGALDFEEKPPAIRASHVEPCDFVLRALFHLLRKWFGDKGRMSEFTRAWPTKWRVNMNPVGGGILFETYYNRRTAIDAEVEALNNLFIGE